MILLLHIKIGQLKIGTKCCGRTNPWYELENYPKSHKSGDKRMKSIFPNVLYQNSKDNALELWFGHVLLVQKSVHWLYLIVEDKADKNICRNSKSVSFHF